MPSYPNTRTETNKEKLAGGPLIYWLQKEGTARGNNAYIDAKVSILSKGRLGSDPEVRPKAL